MELNFRQATDLDIDKITQWTLLLHKHEDDNQLALHKDLKKNLKRWLSSEINNSNNLFIIAQYNKKDVGFISASCIINDNGFLIDPIKGVVQLLWLENSVRRQGIASKLLEQVELCFLDLGIKYIECNYTVCNKQAEKFWDNHAFKPCSTTARKIIA